MTLGTPTCESEDHTIAVHMQKGMQSVPQKLLAEIKKFVIEVPEEFPMEPQNQEKVYERRVAVAPYDVLSRSDEEAKALASRTATAGPPLEGGG